MVVHMFFLLFFFQFFSFFLDFLCAYTLVLSSKIIHHRGLGSPLMLELLHTLQISILIGIQIFLLKTRSPQECNSIDIACSLINI